MIFVVIVFGKKKKTYYHIFYLFHFIFRENPVVKPGLQFRGSKIKKW